MASFSSSYPVEHLVIGGIDLADELAIRLRHLDLRRARSVEPMQKGPGGNWPDQMVHGVVQTVKRDGMRVDDRTQVMGLRQAMRVAAQAGKFQKPRKAGGRLSHDGQIARHQILGATAIQDLVAIEAYHPLQGIAPDKDGRVMVVIPPRLVAAGDLRNPGVGCVAEGCLETGTAVFANIGVADPLSTQTQAQVKLAAGLLRPIVQPEGKNIVNLREDFLRPDSRNADGSYRILGSSASMAGAGLCL